MRNNNNKKTIIQIEFFEWNIPLRRELGAQATHTHTPHTHTTQHTHTTHTHTHTHSVIWLYIRITYYHSSHLASWSLRKVHLITRAQPLYITFHIFIYISTFHMSYLFTHLNKTGGCRCKLKTCSYAVMAQAHESPYPHSLPQQTQVQVNIYNVCVCVCVCGG